MAAKSDTKKQRSPEIEIVWKDNVPEATYFNRNGYSIVAKVENGQFENTQGRIFRAHLQGKAQEPAQNRFPTQTWMHSAAMNLWAFKTMPV